MVGGGTQVDDRKSRRQPSLATCPSVSARMSRVRQRDTKPEMLLRRALHAKGLRYRVQLPLLSKPRRTADIVFTRQRIAVFVDGCFWHGCPIHGTEPKANASFWQEKIRANVARDEDTTRRLEEMGRRVLRIWVHVPLDEAVDLVEMALAKGPNRGKTF